MSKLHELLAVETDLQNVFKVVVNEAQKTFKGKQNMFIGYERHLETFNEDDNTSTPDEKQHIETTIAEKLDYIAEKGSRYINAVFQKEATNQIAKADIIIDNETIAAGIPATFLLGLEAKLKNMRDMYIAIPTLQPGIEWIWNIDLNAYKMADPEIKMRTSKTFKHKVLYEATDKHPAQIEKWEENINTGKYVRNVWSGMISTSDKAIMLGRFDQLLRAIKKARMRANDIKVVDHNDIGEKIFNFIHK